MSDAEQMYCDYKVLFGGEENGKADYFHFELVL